MSRNLMVSRFLLFVLFQFGGFLVQAQCNIKLSGRIMDAETREWLEKAVIEIQEIKKIVETDEKGNYNINGLCPGNYTLIISHVGCQTITEHIHLRADIRHDFTLPHASNVLSNVTVMGISTYRGAQMTSELKGKDIEASRGMSLAESIKKITGVNVLQTGTNIYKPIIHGLHSNRVLILNNGIRQEGQQWGSEHAPEIDPYIANRITVIKGSGALRYGGDAIGGVVLVEPKLLPRVPGINAEINLAGFSNNRMGVASAILEGNSKKWTPFSWRIQGTVKKGGYARTADYWLENSSSQEYNFSTALGYLKEKMGIEVFYSQFNTKLGIFSGSHIGNITDLIEAIENGDPPDYIKNVDFSYTINRPFQEVRHQLVKTKAFYNTGTAGKLNILFSFQDNHREEFDKKKFSSSDEGPQLNMKLYTTGLDIFWDHAAWKGFRGSIGTQATYQHNSYKRRLFIPNYEAVQSGIYWIERLELNKWTMEGGLRWDYRQMMNIQSNAGHIYPDKNFTNVSFNVGGVYKFSDLLKLNANVSSAWRAPQINELYSNGLHHGAARIEIGNTRLKAERAYNFQSAIHWNTEKIQMEAGVYFKRINDFIFLKPTWPPQLTIRGAFPTFEYSQTDARLAGIDFSISGWLTEHFQLGGKASLLRARDLIADDWIIQMPSDRYEGEMGYRFGDSKRWHESYIKVQVQYVTEQTRVPADGNIETSHPDGSVTYESDYAPPPPSYTLLGMEAGTEIIVGKQIYSVAMTVSNLFNTNYRDYMNSFRYYCADMGRNVALKIRIPIVIAR